MTEWYGWAGTILRVNLTTGELVKEPLSRDFAKKYIGGSGMGVRILYDEVGPEVDPLGPENVIIIGQGPLSGTGAPSSGQPGYGKPGLSHHCSRLRQGAGCPGNGVRRLLDQLHPDRSAPFHLHG